MFDHLTKLLEQYEVKVVSARGNWRPAKVAFYGVDDPRCIGSMIYSFLFVKMLPNGVVINMMIPAIKPLRMRKVFLAWSAFSVHDRRYPFDGFLKGPYMTVFRLENYGGKICFPQKIGDQIEESKRSWAKSV